MTNMTKHTKTEYPNIHRLIFMAVIFIILMILHGCKDEKNREQSEPAKELSEKISHEHTAPKTTLANLMAEIKTQNCQQDSDCALIGIGAKPCGGPDSYTVYSKKSSDVAKVTNLADIYQQQMEQYYKDNAIMGICVVAQKPSIACQNNRCVLTENDSNLL